MEDGSEKIAPRGPVKILGASALGAVLTGALLGCLGHDLSLKVREFPPEIPGLTDSLGRAQDTLRFFLNPPDGLSVSFAVRDRNGDPISARLQGLAETGARLSRPAPESLELHIPPLLRVADWTGALVLEDGAGLSTVFPLSLRASLVDSFKNFSDTSVFFSAQGLASRALLRPDAWERGRFLVSGARSETGTVLPILKRPSAFGLQGRFDLVGDFSFEIGVEPVMVHEGDTLSFSVRGADGAQGEVLFLEWSQRPEPSLKIKTWGGNILKEPFDAPFSNLKVTYEKGSLSFTVGEAGPKGYVFRETLNGAAGGKGPGLPDTFALSLRLHGLGEVSRYAIGPFRILKGELIEPPVP